MSFSKLAALVALLGMLGTSAARAGVQVIAVVNNNTSSPVSLISSGTYGTFSPPPPTSIAASSTRGATTFTPLIVESGFLRYGACTISWDVYVDYYTIYTDASAAGSGCSATVLSETSMGAYRALVIVELDIN